MPVGDTSTSYLLALASARMTFNLLSVLKDAFGNDLEMGKVAFAMALRGWPDHFAIAKSEGLTPRESAKKYSNLEFTISIYELTKLTRIDRATVRRKLYKLEKAGYASRHDNGNWALNDYSRSSDPNARATLTTILMLQIEFYQEINTLDNINILASKLASEPSLTTKKVSGLDLDDIQKKQLKNMQI